MTSISGGNGYRVDLSQIKKLELTSSSIRKLTDEEKAKFEKIREMAYAKPANLDEWNNHISQKTYAEVQVDGKVVATLYNSGAAQTSNAGYGAIANLPSMGEEEKATGPEIAQKRAEEIAKALGGTVVKANTAVTQAQYLATPAFKPEYVVDYEAMNAALGRVATAKTQADTQLLASDEASANSVVDEFLDFTGKSWEERVRAMILNSMGLKEEDLAGLSAEEREKIEARIKEKIESEIEKKTGMAVGSAVSAS